MVRGGRTAKDQKKLRNISANLFRYNSNTFENISLNNQEKFNLNWVLGITEKFLLILSGIIINIVIIFKALSARNKYRSTYG